MTIDHYGLEFALQNDPEAIEKTVKRLEKANRARVTIQDKRLLKVGLAARMKVRDAKSARRRKEHMK